MSFCISTRSMPSIHNYEQAKKYFESVPQQKGQIWGANKRPLDTTRMHHKHTVRHADHFALCLFDTERVSYFEDGRVGVHMPDTTSSRAFMWRVGPEGIQYHSHNGQVFLKVRGQDGEYFGEPRRSYEKFEPGDKPGTWQFNPNDFYPRKREYIDRKLAAEVMKKFRAFEKWTRVVEALHPPPASARYYTNQSVRDIAQLIFTEAPRIKIHEAASYNLWARGKSFHNELRNELYMLVGAVKIKDVPFDQPPRRGRTQNCS